eukprot:9081512-Alexandrium_andersonii.AAC.1
MGDSSIDLCGCSSDEEEPHHGGQNGRPGGYGYYGTALHKATREGEPWATGSFWPGRLVAATEGGHSAEEVSQVAAERATPTARMVLAQGLEWKELVGHPFCWARGP